MITQHSTQLWPLHPRTTPVPASHVLPLPAHSCSHHFTQYRHACDTGHRHAINFWLGSTQCCSGVEYVAVPMDF
jgi:hypothetical protein